MLRFLSLASTALAALVAMGGCSVARDLNVTNAREDTPQYISDPSFNQLVHVQGKFINIQPTGKRHQSFVFTFRIHDRLHGLGQAPSPIDELVRFELYQDFGGRELVAELSGQNPIGGEALAAAAMSVNSSHAYQLVLWRFQSSGRQQIDAQLVGSPIPVRE